MVRTPTTYTTFTPDELDDLAAKIAYCARRYQEMALHRDRPLSASEPGEPRPLIYTVRLRHVIPPLTYFRLHSRSIALLISSLIDISWLSATDSHRSHSSSAT